MGYIGYTNMGATVGILVDANAYTFAFQKESGLNYTDTEIQSKQFRFSISYLSAN